MAGAEPADQIRDEKLHAVLTRSIFQNQNIENAPFSDHFWKLRCRKNACRCGASFYICYQERIEVCLHLRESHILAKDVVRKADFDRRCLFERCKVGKCFFVCSGAVPAETVDGSS